MDSNPWVVHLETFSLKSSIFPSLDIKLKLIQLNFSTENNGLCMHKCPSLDSDWSPFLDLQCLQTFGESNLDVPWRKKVCTAKPKKEWLANNQEWRTRSLVNRASVFGSQPPDGSKPVEKSEELWLQKDLQMMHKLQRWRHLKASGCLIMHA